MKKALAVLLALVMVLGLVACGGKEQKIENPNLITIGDYQALYKGAWITKDFDGDDAIVIPFTYTNNSDETKSFMWAFFYELTQGGIGLDNSTIFVSEDSYDTLSDDMLTDVAAGASLDVNLTYKLNNLTDPIIIEFSDLMDKDTAELTIDVTKLKTQSAPDKKDEDTTETSADPAADGKVTYKLTSFVADGQEMGADMVEMLGGGYMVFNGDGNGIFAMFGETFPVTYDDSAIKVMGDECPYTVSGDGMEFEMEGISYSFEVTDETPDLTVPDNGGSESASTGSSDTGKGGKGGKGNKGGKEGYAFDADFAEGYMGDWHGVAEFYDCTGDYSDEDGQQCDIAARIIFDEDGYCEPYIRLCLSEPENENFVIDSMDYDAEYDCMLINGTLSEKPLDPVESFVELEGEVLYIGATYDDGSGDVFNVLGCLRRLDDQWDYENDYPYLVQEGVDFYMGMSFEERIELFGYDTSLIPDLSGTSTGDSSNIKTEEQPKNEEKPEGQDLPFETGITSGDGIVELQQLKDLKEWVYSVNTYENNYYKPTYEECLEHVGVDPAPSRPEKWEDDYVTYVWSTADGKDKLTLTLQPAEDGSGWIYKAISFTGGVNG